MFFSLVFVLYVHVLLFKSMNLLLRLHSFKQNGLFALLWIIRRYYQQNTDTHLDGFKDVNVYIGQRRTALLRIGTQMRVGKTLEQLQAHLEPRIKQVLQVMSFSHADITAALSDRVRFSPGNKEGIADSMRAFKSSPGRSSQRRHTA